MLAHRPDCAAWAQLRQRMRRSTASAAGSTVVRMTTLANRPNTSLLVIDVQNGIVEGNWERDKVVANIATLVEKARRQDLPVGKLVIAGAQTDECIRSTLHGAIARGYDATLVSDAHTTEDQSPWGAPTPDKVIAHTNLYWENHQAPGRTAGTVTTEEVDFRA
jgi:isochorismate hydrolase